MAKMYYDTTGSILSFQVSEWEMAQFGAPSGAAGAIDFDPSTNPVLVTAYKANPNSFSVANGTVMQDGQAVTINPPSQDSQTRQLVTQVAQALSTGQFQGANVTLAQANQDWQAIQAGTATSQQVQRFLVFLGRIVGYELKAFLRNGTL